MYDKVEEYNAKDKKTLAKFVFRFIDFFLTRNDIPFFGKISKKIRCFLARRISKGIEKGAIIVPGVCCESHGCIGIRCVTCWGLHIKKHTMMGPDCRFFSYSHKRANAGKFVFKGFEAPKPIYIGADCWIGYNVVVTAGVSIGEGVTIGALSVVTHNVPSFCLVAGTPATIKKRYLPPQGYYD